MIRRIKEEDLAAINEIHSKRFAQDFDFENYIEGHPFNYGIVRVHDDNVVGYLVAQTIFESSDLFYVAVHPDFLRLGHGQQLMDQYFKDCRMGEVINLSLEVRVSNVAAIKMYEKYGYVAVTTRKNYYADGEDAVLMVQTNQT